MAKDKGSQSHLLDLIDDNDRFLPKLSYALAGVGACLYENHVRHPVRRGTAEDEAEWTVQDFIREHFDKKYLDQRFSRQLWVSPNPPKWDLISTCSFDGLYGAGEGLVLLEAKAHEAELSWEGKRLGASASYRSKANHDRISEHVDEAGRWLNRSVPGTFKLDIDDRYQLANRLTTLACVARIGIPVVLVYWGFIGDREGFPRDYLWSQEHWQRCMGAYVHGVAPQGMIGRTCPVKDDLLRDNYLSMVVGASDVRRSNA
jgi:hypothetical protein